MQKVIVNTRAVGYKSQDKTVVHYSFHFETRECSFAKELLGDTYEAVVFDSFEVEGLDALASDFQREGESLTSARDLTLKHIQGLVKDHINVFNEYQRQRSACVVQAA